MPEKFLVFVAVPLHVFDRDEVIRHGAVKVRTSALCS